MDSRIAVLGCGPAGLLVAHAVTRAGLTPIIYSRKQPSSIGGAQYLHSAIPDLTGAEPDGEVEFIFTGKKEVYATKVYGDPYAKTSWDSYQPGTHGIWSMRKAYDELWQRYSEHIQDQEVDRDIVQRINEFHPYVFSTIPPASFCYNAEHEFIRQRVRIVYGEAHRQVDLDGNDYIMYNGEEDIPWYRRSVIFGWYGMEYPPETAPHGAATVMKPLSTTCNCFPTIRRFGRYGQFRKEVLIHQAYHQAVEFLEEDA